MLTISDVCLVEIVYRFVLNIDIINIEDRKPKFF